jgi:Protein of unknown function (DUF1573)
MKKFATLFILIAAFLFGKAQNTAMSTVATPADVLQLKETEHNFDKIPQGKPVYYSFEITNTGKTELKLDDVHASCGCTTPEWSHDPIAPGATAKIKVGYNASAEGPFDKYITVTYNTNQTKQIKITGIVWKAPAGAAPVNASVELLKKSNL